MNILERLPIPRIGFTVSLLDGREAVVNPYQVPVWVSLSAKEELEWEPDRLRFPAILDTGLSHNFAIPQEDLDHCEGLRLVDTGNTVKLGDWTLPTKTAHVWIHPNMPGQAGPSDLQPVRLRLPDGIIVYPTKMPNPARLPILGLRAFVNSDLILIHNGKLREVTLSADP
jgi:hypothetical protein